MYGVECRPLLRVRLLRVIGKPTSPSGDTCSARGPSPVYTVESCTSNFPPSRAITTISTYPAISLFVPARRRRRIDRVGRRPSMVGQFESPPNSKALVNSTFRRALRGTAVGAVQPPSPCKTPCCRWSHGAALLTSATSAAAPACSAAATGPYVHRRHALTARIARIEAGGAPRAHAHRGAVDHHGDRSR